jgi:malic enzyme
MESYTITYDTLGTPCVEVPIQGADLLQDPMYNKGTAFTEEERHAFGLVGLLPRHVSTLEEQCERTYAGLQRKTDDLERFIGLAALQDRNEVLFYRLLHDHLEEYLPIVYTPTVGQACQQYSHIFRRARGLWITPEYRGQIVRVLRNAPYPDVRLIVVTDNERILGLGDQGAGGMGIPVGKLTLYTVAAGIHPSQTLPISLDVGTDNPSLLEDPLYLGWREPRLRGAEYDALVEEFVQAVREVFPDALLQWEDFKKANAFALLDRYRQTLCSFNDDIQGTAAVAVAGVVAGCHATGRPLPEQRVVILGAGAAGVGIARQLRDACRTAGLAGEDLGRAIALLDSRGLLHLGREIAEEHKREFAWPAERLAAAGLADADLRDPDRLVEVLRPTCLIGTTGQPGAFTERMVRSMASHTERPLLFPLSNPTSKCEAEPRDLLTWTAGRAVVATGSPFAPVPLEDGRVVRITQANNAYVFPGVGLGVILARARVVTDAVFTVAATTLAEQVSQTDMAGGALFPPIARLRRVTAAIAAAVMREVGQSGAGLAYPDDEIADRVAKAMWWPRYPRLVPCS